MTGTCLRVVEDAEFESEVMNESKPVLVDFFTEWCPPCNMMAPVVEQLCTDLHDTLKFVKVDCEKSRQTAQLFNIKVLPTFLMIRDGKVIGQSSGAQAKKKFQEWIETTLAHA